MSGDAPELTTELVVDGVVPSQPVISPDGRWVAYVVGNRRQTNEPAFGLRFWDAC